MFGRKQSPLPEEPTAPLTDEVDPRAPKGRPTPSRREAEAARKQQVKIPKDPKAAKAAPAEKAAAGTARLDEARGMVYDSPPAETDDLKLISGVGPVLEEKLNSVGIYRFEQIANWTEQNVEEFEELLSFKGRVERVNWIAQAKDLAAGRSGN